MPSCRPSITPGAKASPAPLLLLISPGGTRTAACRQIAPVGCGRDAAGREVDHGQITHAQAEQLAGRVQRIVAGR